MPALSVAAYKKKARNLLAAALEDTGLFHDEAWSMVNTWSHSYFETPGLRILYVLPRSWTDALLPIQIQPTPDALERTLVGRIEAITLTQEKHAIAEISAMSQNQNPDLYQAAGKLFQTLGRFAEPISRRACSVLTKSAEAQTVTFCENLLPYMHREL